VKYQTVKAICRRQRGNVGVCFVAWIAKSYYTKMWSKLINFFTTITLFSSFIPMLLLTPW